MEEMNNTPETEAQEQESPREPIGDILARAKEASVSDILDKTGQDKSQKTSEGQDPSSKEEKNTPQNEDQKTPQEETTTKSSPKAENADDEDVSSETHDTEDSSTSLTHWQKEAEKSQQRLADSQKWGREAHNKLKAVEGMVAQYKEAGILNEEEAQTLLSVSAHPDPQQAEEQDEPLLVRYGMVWDRELSNMRKYTDSPDLDLHIEAFQNFLKNGSPSEIMEAFQQLKALEKDDVAFTKKMLEMGKVYYEDVYSDLHAAGSLKAYKEKMALDLEKQLKKIDKLEKEIVKYKEQYEDYIPSKSYRLPSGGSAESPKDSDTSIGSIIDRAKSGSLIRR